jgi:hypothetical protein
VISPCEVLTVVPSHIDHPEGIVVFVPDHIIITPSGTGLPPDVSTIVCIVDELFPINTLLAEGKYKFVLFVYKLLVIVKLPDTIFISKLNNISVVFCNVIEDPANCLVDIILITFLYII